jgi:small subunit ribosomal protein S20
MPNTKSAERRMRNSSRKRLHNRAAKSRLKTLEARLRSAVETKKPDQAAALWRVVQSAFDKAAKSGVIHAATASRKKSRLAAVVATAH